MSRRTSVISATHPRDRKHSTHHDQRQAERSLLLEQGLSIRTAQDTNTNTIREEDVSRSFLQDYFIKPRLDEPKTLTRADTALSPLELKEYHPGDKLFVRRPTEHQVTGAYRKPFEEPDLREQAVLEKGNLNVKGQVKRWPTMPRRTLTRDGDSDLEYAHTRINTRPSSDARREASLLHRLFHLSTSSSSARPAGSADAFDELDGRASLPPPLPADAREQRGVIYVLEYSAVDDNLSSSPPHQFTNVKSLKAHLDNDAGPAIALRMIYCCNDEETVDFLSSNFGISGASTENDERSFRDWMLDRKTSKRAANKARKWRPAYDKARKLVCSAFAVDFGHVLFSDNSPALSRTGKPIPTSQQVRLHESDQRQRIAVYMQRTVSDKVPGAQMTSFNTGANSLPEYAKCPTVIISEFSAAGAGEIINAGPLLGLDVSQKGSATPLAVIQAIEYILEHVVSGIVQLWEEQIELLHEPHTKLEDYIWAQPADSSRAREVWGMSRRLHTMVKLINRHAKLIQFAQEDFRIFAQRSDEQDWLDTNLDHFAQLSENISVDYVEPLEDMIDLMYKSVTIRDSRQSLELNASLWRLSWITFVFLPLTFLAGFFGMNVDVFRHFPSVKWYFVCAVPMLIIVFFFWMGLATFAPGSKKTDYSAAEMEDLGAALRDERLLEAHHRPPRGPIRRSLARFSGRR